MRGGSEILLATIVIGVLAMMIVPMPAPALDVTLTMNISVSLLTLLVAMHILKPVELSVFPSLLLMLTLFRLSLNVASARRILLHGHEGPDAAGSLIHAFGQFVVGGNFMVGFIVFIILVVIQFVVITKGAGRIAEVAARFTVDAMPGKQMAIDAELNAGLIDEKRARERREAVAREADFYGSMDGASKFVRGDAVAGLIITAVNIVGGLAIGVLQQGLGLSQALETYTILTVGDGLVTQLPALLVSTASGIIVTRAANESDLSKDLIGQLTARPRTLGMAAGITAPHTKDAATLAEWTRAAIPTSVVKPYLGDGAALEPLVLRPATERVLRDALRRATAPARSRSIPWRRAACSMRSGTVSSGAPR
jgi:flagellar biosynthesis protein FlhA